MGLERISIRGNSGRDLQIGGVYHTFCDDRFGGISMIKIEIELEDCEDVVSMINMVDELFTFVRKIQ